MNKLKEKPLTKKDLAEFAREECQFLWLVDVLYKKNILNKNDIKTIEEL